MGDFRKKISCRLISGGGEWGGGGTCKDIPEKNFPRDVYNAEKNLTPL